MSKQTSRFLPRFEALEDRLAPTGLSLPAPVAPGGADRLEFRRGGGVRAVRVRVRAPHVEHAFGHELGHALGHA
jgi:hypothetical protein